MIKDANTVVRDAVLRADICIVGAGAAGIALALSLVGERLSVLLLEAGGDAADPATQALYAGEVDDPALHSPPDTYRQRRFGGSTTIWGGRCVPFDPIDLQHRAWIPHSSWPIDYPELLRHYPAANALCEAGECVYDANRALPGAMRPMLRGFAPRDFSTDPIERFSCPTDFGRRHRARLDRATNIRVLLNANCTRLLTSSDGARVEIAQVETIRGNRFVVQADQFVLATGGLEVPRLLLASRETHMYGLGNAEDLVGRFYMCHIAGTVGTLQLDVPDRDVWHGYDQAEDGTYCRRRIALTAESQRRHELGNIVFRLHHPRIPDPQHRTGALSAIYLARRFISYEYAHRLTGEQSAGFRRTAMHAANVVLDAPSVARFAWHWLRRRSFAQRKFPSVVVRPRSRVYSLDFHAEQTPNHASRVRLTEAVGSLGLPRLRIEWRYSGADIRTVAGALGLLSEAFADWGRGTLSFEENERDIEAVIRREGAFGGHHIGTARMGVSPTTGVVDSDCRVFGVNNLYVAGSAVFPTSGQANPTLTIVALAIRLAAHLKTAAACVPTVSAVGASQLVATDQ